MASDFKTRACWFLEIALVCLSVCVSMCSPLRALITSGMIRCDVNRVWLVKQVLEFSRVLNCFIWHLLLIKWMGMALSAQHIVSTCQRRLKWCGTRLPERHSASVIKVSEWMHSDTFKRRLVFAFAVIISTIVNFVIKFHY